MLNLLIVIVVILFISRLAAEIAERMGSMSLIGELVAGIFLGIFVMNYPNLLPQFLHIKENEGFKVLCELGILFLMLSSGFHIDVDHLLQSSKKGVVIALGGLILPLGLGYALGEFFLPESDLKTIQSFFIGVALSITAIAVSTRALIALGQDKTKLGGAIISAAIIDDILGLFLLAILLSILNIGRMPSLWEFVILASKIFGFFVFAFLTGKYGINHIKYLLNKSCTEEAELCIVLILSLAFAIIAHYAGMHVIIGAFVAGMLIKKGCPNYIGHIKAKISGITLGFFGPIFFTSIGLHLNLEALRVCLPFVLSLTVVATIGKVVGCGFMAKLMKFSSKESFAIGFGMNGRGAVELIVATIALEAGLFSRPTPIPPIVSSIFSAVVIMTIITTIIAPIGLQLLLKNKKE